MDVVLAQVLTMLSLFVSMVLCCLFPYFLVRNYKRKQHTSRFEGNRYEVGISFANCFSGGVFVATFFVGLLPHVRQEFEEILVLGELETNFPLTEFVVFMGFFLALLIEHLTIMYQEKKRNKSKHQTASATHEELRENGSTSSRVKYENPTSDNDHERAHLDIEVNGSSVEDADVDRHNHGHEHHGHSHDITGIISHDNRQDSGLRFYMLVLSLSVHSIFEGMALGLQRHLSDLINLFVGVIIHECLMAFAMGVSMSKIKPSLGIILKFSILFSIMIPIGQALGLLVGNQQSFSGKVSGAILQGIAAGTFIHVTFFEVIPAELYNKKYILLKILFLFLGFTVIVGCIFALDDHHSHTSNGNHLLNVTNDHHDH